ncbi:MAG: hypothetical protein WD669_06550 [Pirellulales bacterium]
MLKWLSHLDRLLRGETTRPQSLRDGQIAVDASGMAVMIVLLGAIYGLCMGSFSALRDFEDPLRADTRYLQLLATMVKVPALFYLTLFVTFPSLYVFNALVGSRLSLVNVLRLLVASVAVNLAVLASLGPIVLFFSVSTKSYSFILLLNVVACSVAGFLGLVFLLQTLHRMTAPVWELPPPPREGDVKLDPIPSQPASEDWSALDMPSGQTLGRHTRLVFGCWVVVFALVGAQMGWVLRPFVGNPALPFQWFRDFPDRGRSNFFEAVLKALQELFSRGG